MKTLSDTDGEGKTCDLEKLPEELRARLEDAVIVENGSVGGMKYYVTAEVLGDVDMTNPADALLGLEAIFVNQSERREASIPKILIAEGETCSFDVTDEPEQIWEGSEDGEDSANGRETTATWSARSKSAEGENSRTRTGSPSLAPDSGDLEAKDLVSEVGRSTPSEAGTVAKATPSAAEDQAANVWQVGPMSAKRIYLQPQFKIGTEPCNFLTDVQVTKLDGHGVADAPIDIDKEVNIEWKYEIPAGGGILPNKAYTFGIPDVFRFENFKIPLRNGDTGSEIGQVVLDGLSGTITFNDIAQAEGVLSSGTMGYFTAKAGINEDKTGNGGLTSVTFPDIAVSKSVDIYFPLNPIEADVKFAKSAVLNSVHNKIRWTITVTPEMKNVQRAEDGEFSSLKIRDTLTEKSGFSLDVDSSGDLAVEVKDSRGTVINGGTVVCGSEKRSFEYTFPGKVTANVPYTLSYDTVFSLESWKDVTADDVTFENSVDHCWFSYYNYVIDEISKKAVKSGEATQEDGPVGEEGKASQKVSGNFITKTGTKSADGTKIDWVITVNANKFSMSSVTIVDKITAAGKEEPTDNIKFTGVQVKIGTGAFQPVTPSSVSEGKKESSFELNLGSISDVVKIQYSTNIDVKFQNSNEETKFSNGVTLRFDPSIEIKGGGNTIKTGSRLLDKSGTYDSRTHAITWKITVNQQKLALTGANVTDKIPAGLTLVGGAAGVVTANGSVTVNGDEIKVTYPPSFSEQDTITFKTTVDNPDLWATNKGETVMSNSATLAAGGMTQSTYTKKADVKITSEVLKKRGIDYDEVSKRVTWGLTVNKNEMEMTNPVITDVIPTGQKFVDQGDVASSFAGDTDAIEGYTYDETAGRLIVTLSSPLSGKKEIRYQTELTDLSILETNGNVTVSNSASISCGEMAGTITSAGSSANQTVSKSIVTKKGAPDGAEGIITWTVNINKNRVPIVNPVLEDSLDPNLALAADSVKLRRLDEAGTPHDETVEPSNVSYENNKFVFSFNKTIEDEYILTFDTYFKVDGNYTNSIGLIGSGGSIQLSGSSGSVFAKYLSGSGGTRPTDKGRIKITKTEEGTGNPIPGVTFSLSKGAVSMTATTDENGVAEFENLWAGTYYLKETAAPDDYYFDPEETRTFTLTNGDDTQKTVSITNKRKCGIAVTKKDAETGNVLSGAKIRVENKADPSEHYEKETNINGEAFFGDLKQGVYTVKETQAPPGYLLSASEQEVSLTSADVLEKVEITNVPMKGSLKVLKVEKGGDVSLPGAQIALYTEDGVKLGSLTTGDDGTATFENLRYGDYDLIEEKAPDGYELDSSRRPVSFHITSDGQTLTYRLENRKASPDTGLELNPGHGSGGNGGGSSGTGNTPGGNSPETSAGPGAEPSTDPLPKGQSPQTGLPQGEELERLRERLPDGTYKIYTLDENGMVLGEQIFTIADEEVPQAVLGRSGLPKVGDGKIPKEAWFALMCLSLAGILLLNRKKVSR